MTVEIRILGPNERDVLTRVAPDVFDHDIDEALTEEFLRDAHHHLAVAIDAGVVVGFASAVHYVHPDKAPELWVNEVGVAPSHRRQGVGERLLHALFARGSELGCRTGWVLTSPANMGAMRLYEAAGGSLLTDPPAMFTFRLSADLSA